MIYVYVYMGILYPMFNCVLYPHSYIIFHYFHTLTFMCFVIFWHQSVYVPVLHNNVDGSHMESPPSYQMIPMIWIHMVSLTYLTRYQPQKYSVWSSRSITCSRASSCVWWSDSFQGRQLGRFYLTVRDWSSLMRYDWKSYLLDNFLGLQF